MKETSCTESNNHHMVSHKEASMPLTLTERKSGLISWILCCWFMDTTPEGGVSINRNIPISYSRLLGGSASFPGNAAAKRAFSRARSVYCSVHFRAP